MSTNFDYINIEHCNAKLVSIRPARDMNFNEEKVVFSSIVVASRLKAGLSTEFIHLVKNVLNIEHALDECENWFYNRDYLLIRISRTMLAFVLENKEKNCFESIVAIIHTKHKLTIYAQGNGKEHLYMKRWFSSKFEDTGSLVYTIQRIKRTESPVITQEYVLRLDNTIGRDSFYPWLNIPMEEYFEKFMNSNENVLVLFGPPGTGKSTFIRSLILSKYYTAYLAYSKTAIESTVTIEEYYANEEARILVYEDIDTHLAGRDTGNDLMSTLLNAVDGVVSSPKKKIIFSSNLPSADIIDPALLRVGRCFDVIEFKELTPEQAEKITVDVGKQFRDFSTRTSWSLSDVLNEDKHTRQVIQQYSGARIGYRK